MDIRSNVLRQLKNRREGFSLEQPFYIDEDYFKLDMEMIYYRDWLFMGHDCELPKPGAYFTVQIGQYPVVIVRGRDNVIRAFHNSCRHRGSRVCTKEHGSSVRLVCPYHQWAYDLDGKLAFARHMG
ncbi:MAG TPA: aromatic ring-hydroxylating dioxygenase subunit alpha, partial [Sphingobium sp.]